MKVYAISDFHLSINNPKPMNIFGPVWDGYLETIERDWNDKVTDEDIVLISGDLSWAMFLEDAVADIAYIGGMKGRKVIIRGNHDYWWKSISAVRAMLPDGMYAVQKDAVRLDNCVICGTRLWTTPEPGREQLPADKTIYDRELLRLRMSLDRAAGMREAGDKLIVMVHYPPFNSTFRPTVYTEAIAEYSPDAVVYGHLHGNVGRMRKKLILNDIPYYLTSCDLIGNKLVEICDA